MTSSKIKKTIICFACNEDGVGPSVFAYYIVKAIVRYWKNRKNNDGLEIRILISNDIAYSFNQKIYSSDEFKGIVNLPSEKIEERQKIDSILRLHHKNGEVSIPETVIAWKGYSEKREIYCNNAREYLHDSCIAIDIGVPLFARCAKEMRIPDVTFFDHSWACTLRGISSKEAEYVVEHPSDKHRAEAEKIAIEIEKDESCASQVFLFDHYITPPEFYTHWKKLGFTPIVLHGVLGGNRDKDFALEKLNSMLVEFNQKPVLPEQKLVLISPGGTPIWNQIIPKLVNEYNQMPRKNYIPIITLPDPKLLEDKIIQQIISSKGIHLIGAVRGDTNQVIMPAFDLVVTRAGGGTVNDCIATQTPFVCVEQRQWQVKLIERECKIHIPPIIPSFNETSLDIFMKDPANCIDKFFTKTPRSNFEINNGFEKDVADLIMSWCEMRK